MWLKSFFYEYTEMCFDLCKSVKECLCESGTAVMSIEYNRVYYSTESSVSKRKCVALEGVALFAVSLGDF